VRDDNSERRLSLLAANFFAHAVKGAKGDARSANLVFNWAEKMRVMIPEESCGAENAGAEQISVTAKSRPTDGLFENLDLNLLSREEQVELSRLADLIDLGADLTGLERLKYLVEKGRGSGVTETIFPQQPENQFERS
jgi:hypothetical protein